MVPETLTKEDLVQWLSELGRPTSQASALIRRCKGHPGKIISALELQTQGAAQLTALEKDVLQRSEEIRSVEELAGELQLGQHALVDIAERLVDLGLAQVLDSGAKIQARPTSES